MSSTETSQIITLTGTAPKFSIDLTPKSIALKEEALALAGAIIRVTNTEEQEKAVEAMSKIKGLLDIAEDARTFVKKPVLEAGRTIDSTAKKFAKELEEKMESIKRMVGNYQLEIRRKAELERQKQEAAERESRRLKEEAEALRQKEEDLKRQLATADKKAAASIKAELLDVGTARSDCEFAAFDMEDQAAAPVTKVEKAEGARVQKDFEIVVEDIKALYAAYPEAVKMEASMVTLRDMVSRRGLRNIPGVKVTEKVRVSVTGTSPNAFLE